jgi:hypothetical protein
MSFFIYFFFKNRGFYLYAKTIHSDMALMINLLSIAKPNLLRNWDEKSLVILIVDIFIELIFYFRKRMHAKI